MTVTNEQIQQYREIVENAPDEATVWCEDADSYLAQFAKLEEGELSYLWVFYADETWWPFEPDGMTLHLLEDIRTIIAQHDEIQRLCELLNNLINVADLNTGHEPSLSVFYRELQEVKEALSND